MKEKVKEYLIGLAENMTATEVVEFMLSSGCLSERCAVHYIVKNEYYKQVWDKENTCNFKQIKIDLAKEWKVSRPTIENIIYKYEHIHI